MAETYNTAQLSPLAEGFIQKFHYYLIDDPIKEHSYDYFLNISTAVSLYNYRQKNAMLSEEESIKNNQVISSLQEFCFDLDAIPAIEPAKTYVSQYKEIINNLQEAVAQIEGNTDEKINPQQKEDLIKQINDTQKKLKNEDPSVNSIVDEYQAIINYCFGINNTIPNLGEFGEDYELAEFISKFANFKDGSEIYHPFSGVDIFALLNPNCKFICEDNSPKVWALMQILIDANPDLNIEFFKRDSSRRIYNSKAKYKNILFNIPFEKGLTSFRKKKKEKLSTKKEARVHNIFVDLFDKKLEDGGTICGIVPSNLLHYFVNSCSDKNYYIKTLAIPLGVKSKYLDSECTLLVIKKEQSDYIEAINGLSYFKHSTETESAKIFYNDLLNDINAQKKDVFAKINYSDIYELDTLYAPILIARHTYENDYPVQPLSSFVSYIDFDVKPISNERCIWKGDLVSEYINCVIYPSKLYQGKIRKIKEAIAITEPCIILKKYGSKNFDFAKVTEISLIEQNPIYLDFNKDSYIFNPIKINNDIILDDYFLYALQSEYIKIQLESPKNPADLFHGSKVPLLLNNIYLPIPPKDVQKQVVNRLKEEYRQKREAELNAEKQRLGIKNAVSDLSHTLGTPFNTIANIIDLLDDEVTESGKKDLIALKDNFNYVRRLLKIDFADFSSMILSEVKIKDFLERYYSAYLNFGVKTFNLSLSCKDIDKTAILGNVDALTVMFDCLLDNAHRHGFNKKYKPENKVDINAYIENENLLITITNNGNLIPSSFTIQEYASRGRFDGNSGRTGLGGAHVYEIVKSMGGAINFESKELPDKTKETKFKIIISIENN